jgi:hypothetical protein
MGKYPAGHRATTAQEQYDAFAELSEQADHARPDQSPNNAPSLVDVVVRSEVLARPTPGHPVHKALLSPAGMYAGITASERDQCGLAPALLDAASLDLLIDDLPHMLTEIRGMCARVPDATGPPSECAAEDGKGAAGSS